MDMNHTTIGRGPKKSYENQRSMRKISCLRWLILAMLILGGQQHLTAQFLDTVSVSTCHCVDGTRPDAFNMPAQQSKDSIIFRSSSPVFIKGWSPFEEPDSILYLDHPSVSDNYYLNGDSLTISRDTLVQIAPDTFKFISYRNANVAFDTIIFMNTDGLTDTLVNIYPACAATVDDAITASPNDTICLSQSVINFTLPMLAGQLSPANVEWNVIYGDPMTGSATPTPLTGSMTAISFFTPGSYKVTVDGKTDKDCPIDSEIDIYVINDNYPITGFGFACVGSQVPYSIPVDTDLSLYDTIKWSVTTEPFPGAAVMIDSLGDDAEIRLDSAGTYVISVSASVPGFGCSLDTTFTTTVAAEIEAGIMGDTVVCVNDIRNYTSNVLNLNTITWSTTSGTILGSSMLPNADIRFNAAGIDTITVAGTTTNGCIVRDTFFVDVKDSQIMLAGDMMVCLGDTAGYRAMYTDSSIAQFTTINWNIVPMDSANVQKLDTVITADDSLTVTWGAIGDYMLFVEGVTALGCDLKDTFVVSVQDTAHVILGPSSLVCTGQPVTFNLVHATDSSAVAGTSISWTVLRHKPGSPDVPVTETDLDSNSMFTHTFATSTIAQGDLTYIVIAEGVSANGCQIVADTFSLRTIGNQDLLIQGPSQLCAGGIDTFFFNLNDTLYNGSLNWSGYHVNDMGVQQPLLPGAIDQSRGDTAIINFPNVADTFYVEVTGMAGPTCTFTTKHKLILIDTLEIINAANLDTLCLTADSTWYAVNIDTSRINIASTIWSITNTATNEVVFPAMTGSNTMTGSASFLSIAYVYPGPGIYTHRVRGEEIGTGCEFDEFLTVTVKDTTYFIENDPQTCLGDTVKCVLLDANMMPLTDFPGNDSVNWMVGNAMTGSSVSIYTPGAFNFVDTFIVNGGIGDTLCVVWKDPGSKLISVMDSTICCPLMVRDTVLVRDNMDFFIYGDDSVCQGDTTGYKILNIDSSEINDFHPDSSVHWSVQWGSVLNASQDSITVIWDFPQDSVRTFDTIFFNGYTDSGCAINEAFIVGIRNRDFIITANNNICQGDAVNLQLLNGTDSSMITDVAELTWIFSPGNDTITIAGTTLDKFIESDGDTVVTWTEAGNFTVRAIGYTTGDSCKVDYTFPLTVNENPNPEIKGDLNTCVNTTDIFYVDVDMSLLDSIRWEVNGNAGTPNAARTILNGQGTTQIEVLWTSVPLAPRPYNFEIIVTGYTKGGCTFTDLKRTVIIDAANVGQLACHNDINVTLPDNCELELRPEQILADPDTLIPDEQYEIIVEDAQSGVMLSEGLVDASLLGIQLKVIITHECSGQTCWGYITLEDKNIPDLLCASDTISCVESVLPEDIGFPVPNTATVVRTSTNPPIFTVTNFEKCGPATLTHTDRISSEVCSGNYGTVIFRDWKMTNQAGLMSTCTDTIYVGRIDVDSLDLSALKNFVGSEAFECNQYTREQLDPGSITGNLNIVSTEQCFNAQVVWNDWVEEPDSCANYTINRTWTILDWCTGNVRTHNQTIQVLDRTPPQISLTSGAINISATDHACSGVYDLTPDINISDNCSTPISVTVRIFENDQLGRLLYTITDGNYIGLAFDPDITQIYIDVEATDACGNSRQGAITREIRITDDVKPVPICDDNTTISIGDGGWAIADWHAFDDGSLDNCGIEKIEIRRMTNNCGDFPENLVFGDYVKFCCEDAMSGEPILVQLRVTDVNGNENECMVSVTVQDNSGLEKIGRQGDFSISCEEPVDPYLVDDGSTVTFLTMTCGIPAPPDIFSAVVDTNDCGVGTIMRNWIITDDLGNTLTHSQVITRGLAGEIFDPADLVNIWPPDYTGEGCVGQNTSVDNIPAAYLPNIDLAAYTCSSLGLDHEDLIFRNVEGFCAKVIRTWYLYDWCQRDPVTGQPQSWEYVQILRLNDTTAPVIDSGCDTESFLTGSASNCSASVNTMATADDCHDNDDLIWSYEIVDFNGTTVLQGNTNIINTSLEVGVYNVTWTVADPCGNDATCVKEIQVFDGTAPTVAFRDITRMMGNAGNVTVDASELVSTSEDNCSPQGTITYHFDAPDGPASRSFSCSDLTGMNSLTVHPDIYAVDESGNAFKGHADITIEDVNNVCPNTGSVIVAGEIFTERDFTVDEVEVTLTSMNTGASLLAMTPLEGAFSFVEVPMNDTYELSAARRDDYLNGVSTLDLLLIQRHILGLRDLDSPYKVIAADVDGSDHVSAVDLVHMRRLILGLTDKLPIDRSWTFVDAHQNFPNTVRPFPYAQTILIDDLNENHMDMNFIAVKIGDVNGNVQLQSALLGLTRSIEVINIEEVDRSGNEVTISLTPNSGAHVAGMQLSLGLMDGVEVIDVHSDQIDITSDHYSVIDDELRISWNELQSARLNAESILTIKLRIKDIDRAVGELIRLSDQRFTSEIYTQEDGTLGVHHILLEFKEVVADEVFTVEQNVPNPFRGNTSIRFYQPTKSEVRFTVTDLSGRQLVNNIGTYDKGWHTMQLTTDDLPGSGIYIYEMSNGTDVIRKRMITID